MPRIPVHVPVPVPVHLPVPVPVPVHGYRSYCAIVRSLCAPCPLPLMFCAFSLLGPVQLRTRRSLSHSLRMRVRAHAHVRACVRERVL